MAKLYFTGNSDCRKNPFTSRGHKELTGTVFFNWDGGKTSGGTVLEFTVKHTGTILTAEIIFPEFGINYPDFSRIENIRADNRPDQIKFTLEKNRENPE